MTIDLPELELRLLSEQARNAGYTDLESFAEAHLVAIAHQQTTRKLAPMSQEELEESCAMIERSMRDIEAGRVLTVEEARKRSLARLSEPSE